MQESNVLKRAHFCTHPLRQQSAKLQHWPIIFSVISFLAAPPLFADRTNKPIAVTLRERLFSFS
jgi:hypothetical protein